MRFPRIIYLQTLLGIDIICLVEIIKIIAIIIEAKINLKEVNNIGSIKGIAIAPKENDPAIRTEYKIIPK